MHRFSPMPLRRVPQPFDDPDWCFELKYDGFRGLAFVTRKGVQLVSRTGHVYRQFADLELALRAELKCQSAVLDGEVVCLDDRGRADFLSLLRRRGAPSFVAFDVLAINGRDVRSEPLRQRKRRLNALLPVPGASVFGLQPIVGQGVELYRLVCANDLEGIVAKRLDAPYRLVEPLTWRKIKNPTYSQAIGRHQLFDRRR